MIDVRDILLLLVAGLATARITSLIVDDAIMEPLRHRVFLWSPPVSGDDPDADNTWYAHAIVDRLGRQTGLIADPPREPGFVGQVVSCIYCTGVWVAAAAYVVAWHVPELHPVLIVAAAAQISEATIKASR